MLKVTRMDMAPRGKEFDVGKSRTTSTVKNLLHSSRSRLILKLLLYSGALLDIICRINSSVTLQSWK